MRRVVNQLVATAVLACSIAVPAVEARREWLRPEPGTECADTLCALYDRWGLAHRLEDPEARGNAGPSEGASNLELAGRWAAGWSLDLVLDGSRAYVGNGGYVDVLDITEPGEPRRIGRASMDGVVTALAVSGSHVLVGLGRAGFRVVDLTDPAHAVEMSRRPFVNVQEIVVRGTYAYVADGTAGFRVVDISDLRRPYTVSRNTQMGWPFQVALAGDSHVLVGEAFGPGLRVVDVSDPANPVIVGSYSATVRDFAASGVYAYVANGSYGLAILDISDPGHPAVLASWDTPDFHYTSNVAVRGDFAYVVGETYWGRITFRVFDVSDRRTPREAGLGYLADDSIPTYDVIVVGGLEADGRHVYVATRRRGLRVVDVRNPAAPLEIGAYATGDGTRRVAIAGGKLFTASGHAGLWVVDAEEPGSPVELGRFDTRGIAWDVALFDHYAAMADEVGVSIIDVSDAAAPREVGYFPGEYVRRVNVEGGIAFAGVILPRYAWFGGALQALDVSDPAHPVGLGVFRPSDDIVWEATLSSDVQDIVISGKTVYTIWQVINPPEWQLDRSYLIVIDASDPMDLRAVGFYRSPYQQYYNGLAVHGDRAYVTYDYGGLLIFDVSDPADPRVIGSHYLQAGVRDAAVMGPYAFLSSREGLRVLNVSDPGNLFEVGYYDAFARHNLSFYTLPASVYGDRVYVPNDADGVYVLRFPQLVQPARVEITPKALNLGSNGQWVMARMELPQEAQGTIEIVSVHLNGSVKPNGPPMWEGETLVMKFPRAEVQQALTPGKSVQLVVGATVGGVAYEGKDVIQVLAKGGAARVSEQDGSTLPARLALHPNTPNPFNPTTTISYSITRPGRVSLAIFSVSGALVRRLVDGDQTPGRYSVAWDGTDNSGQRVASGVYFYKLVAGSFVDTKKMILLK